MIRFFRPVFKCNFGATCPRWRGIYAGKFGFQALHIRYNGIDVALLTPDFRTFRAFLVLTLALPSAPVAYGQVSAAAPPTGPDIRPVELSEIPDRFFPVQDSSGFFWQAFGNGALVSGDTPYLQSGLNLIVDGSPFTPVKALIREPGTGREKIDLRLEENRPDLIISRDLWFDTRRSAVRVFDTLTNNTKTAKVFSVSLRTTYPFAWQSLHGTGGGLLSHDPMLQLGARDYSLCVHFSPSDGRHDTLFVMSSEKGGQMAELKASANARELTFIYPLEIPAGESRSLLHWIMQRNLPDVTRDLAALSPFIQRDRLIVPEIDPANYAQVVNFAATAFQIEATAPAQIKALVALNRLTDRIGFHRRSEDIRWISPTNQISGTVRREGVLTINTSYFGEAEVKVAEIAAIRGAAGSGRKPLVFLRDGRVLTGPVSGGALEWSIGSQPPGTPSAAMETLDVAALNLMLFSTAANDGAAPANTTHFVQLIDGTVLPINAGSSLSMDLVTPWGAEQWLWSDLVEANRVIPPGPGLRVLHRDGSEISALLAGAAWSLPTAAGPLVNVPVTALDSLWMAGGTTGTGAAAGNSWLDFAEVPTGQGPATGFLLEGNQLVKADFASEKISLRQGEQEWQIETSRIVELRRPPEPEASGFIEVELASGEKLTGRLSGSFLNIARNGAAFEIPVSWVLGYRRGNT